MKNKVLSLNGAIIRYMESGWQRAFSTIYSGFEIIKLLNQKYSSHKLQTTFKVTPLVYAIYFATIDFPKKNPHDTFIYTNHYLKCVFVKKSLNFF